MVATEVYDCMLCISTSERMVENKEKHWRGLATLLEGAGLAFDIQKCSNFQKSIMVVLKL